MALQNELAPGCGRKREGEAAGGGGTKIRPNGVHCCGSMASVRHRRCYRKCQNSSRGAPPTRAQCAWVWYAWANCRCATLLYFHGNGGGIEQRLPVSHAHMRTCARIPPTCSCASRTTARSTPLRVARSSSVSRSSLATAAATFSWRVSTPGRGRKPLPGPPFGRQDAAMQSSCRLSAVPKACSPRNFDLSHSSVVAQLVRSRAHARGGRWSTAATARRGARPPRRGSWCVALPPPKAISC